ncbi:MerR family transcriptional regulator [Maricaulis parjimensis]|uniref:MerR family transcriptional regulator n=1 Tax=Maricaulis parjimensis TaxID=144023 RepID=UPI001939F69F|nr:helix-turn-helix domain-containing protein [Maricaulis parjimensis]
MSDMSIGRLSGLSGVKVPTIRYYESIGMLEAPPRSPGGQRRYGDAHLERLRFIRHGRDLGFGLDDLRALQDLSNRPDQSCEEADRIARRQLLDVERRIAGLEAVRHELLRMVERCSHGVVDECRVIQTLSDHALCEHEHGEDQTVSKAG